MGHVNVRWLTAILILWVASPEVSSAQILTVIRNVNLRRDPSTDHPATRLLKPPEELVLRDSTTVNGYYLVYRPESEEEGWVWARNVRLGTPGVLVGAALMVAAAIDPTWAKSAPMSGVFQSPVRALTCGPVGDGGDTATNRLKNRVDIPAAYHDVAWSAIATLEYPDARGTSRLAWPPESLAVIARYESVPVRVVGYLVAIKPQGGTGETTNCHMTRSTETDWHMALVAAPGLGEATAIVVEPTPRIRVQHPRWTVARLGPWLDSGNPVRIAGWLMFDPAHRNHLGRYRSTLWEIHPVTRVEVWSVDRWVSIDSIP